MRKLLAAAAVTALIASAPLSDAKAQGKQLTLCWAAWDPANALVELSKDFTKETGIDMIARTRWLIRLTRFCSLC